MIGTLKNLCSAMAGYLAGHHPVNEDPGVTWRPPEFPILASLNVHEPARSPADQPVINGTSMIGLDWRVM
ncbi:MAG: hypothetical protein R3F30_04240 [Planctomycetota bacterium]